MTETLLSAVMRFLSPEMVGKIASSTGLDRSVAQKAIDASVPAILGGLADLASQPGGARQLASTMAEQPAGLLGSLAGALGGSAQLSDKGESLLSSLLGNGTLGAMASAVSKYVGIGEGSARSLMGLLAPAVMGILGRQQRASGQDASGFARMLAGQKEEFAAAMPAGLAELLPRNLHEGLEAPQTIEGRAYDFPRGAYSAPRTATAPMQRMVSEPKAEHATTWPYWVLPLLAIGGLLWYLLPTDRINRQASEPAGTVSQPVSLPTRQVASPDGRSVYLARAADDSISLAVFHNQEIFNSGGEKLGTVKDLIIGPDGRVNAAILSVGRFLGIGEKDVAVPFSALLVERRDGDLRISVDAVKEALQSAPAFEQVRDRIRSNAPKIYSPDSNGTSTGKGEAPGLTRP